MVSLIWLFGVSATIAAVAGNDEKAIGFLMCAAILVAAERIARAIEGDV